ncbi:retrovirus-related pol polyprotein from transposon TNT 1-94 [Tanacetum coccineum]
MDSRCSRHMTGVKNYLHKYEEQPGPKVVFGDDSTCITKGYGSIKCNGIVFTKVAFVNGLKYNLVSISQLCDAKYIVQFDEKKGIIFNSNKEVVMIAPRVRDVYVLDMTSSAQESCFFAKAFENLNWLWHKGLSHLNFKTINQLAKQNLIIGLPSLVYTKYKPCSSCEKGKHHRASYKSKQTFSIKSCLHLLHMDLFGPIIPRNRILISFCDERGISQNFSSPYTPEQNGVAERKNRTLIEAARTMLSGYVFSKQYWTEAVATTCYTQNRSTIIKRHLKTPYEIFHGRIPNIDFLYVFGCPVYIHNHKDYLGKFDEKTDDGYFLRYSLVSKAFKVFNTRRQQTEETYHITFDKSPDAIKFAKPTEDYLIFLYSETYPPDEFSHSYEPSQKYQVNNNTAPFIDPYESLESDTNKSSDQIDQNDHPVLNDEILNDDQTEHSPQDNDNNIIENLTTNEIGQNSKSSPEAEDASGTDTSPIQVNPSVSIPNTTSSAPQDKWTQNKHIELVNIIGSPGSGMLTRAMAKELGVASAHECLFVDFLSEEEPKRDSEALKHLGWVDSMQEELNQFAKNKVWTLVHAPYGKTIIGSKWPPGFESSEFPNHVCKLDKALCGLKQAPRACENSNPNNLGPGLIGKSVNETQYRGMIGSLMYLTASRPDIQFSTCLCARYQANPKESHLIVVKRIFRYLKGTPSLGLWYPKCSGFDLKGYLNSDYARCNMDRKSTSGACQLLEGKLICWSAKKQQFVAMSSVEAKYVAAVGCCANILWMNSQLTNYDIIYEKVPIFCNTSAIVISNNLVLHSRIKHIDIRYYFIRYHILKGDIDSHSISTC